MITAENALTYDGAVVTFIAWFSISHAHSSVCSITSLDNEHSRISTTARAALFVDQQLPYVKLI